MAVALVPLYQLWQLSECWQRTRRATNNATNGNGAKLSARPTRRRSMSPVPKQTRYRDPGPSAPGSEHQVPAGGFRLCRLLDPLKFRTCSTSTVHLFLTGAAPSNLLCLAPSQEPSPKSPASCLARIMESFSCIRSQSRLPQTLTLTGYHFSSSSVCNLPP